MTVPLSFGRNASFLVSRSHLITRLITPASFLRVNHLQYDKSSNPSRNQYALPHRLYSTTSTRYATGTGTKSVGRPKAHTSKAPARKRTRTAASTSTRKAAGGKGGRKKVVRKSKTKPKSNSTKRVPKKVKSAAAIQKERTAKRKEYKKTALLDAPKKLPESAWLVYCVTNRPKGTSFAEAGQVTKDLGVRYHSLSPEERERLNHTANENKAKNSAAYKTWLSQYTPLQIKEANNARKQIAMTQRPTRTGRKRETHLIKDVRLVKRPRNAYSFFLSERYKSGDFKGMLVKECGPLIGREWKALSASEKKKFQDQATADANRYKEEFKTVYGAENLRRARAAAAASAA